jgi:DNA gyrase subunit B
MREGLTCVLSVKVPEPKFSSQTKDKLVSSEVRGPVEEIVTKTLTDFWMENRTTPKSFAAKSWKQRARAKQPVKRAN